LVTYETHLVGREVGLVMILPVIWMFYILTFNESLVWRFEMERVGSKGKSRL